MDQFLLKLARYKPDLQAAWMLSHLIFAFIMVWAPFIRSLKAATTLVAICGIPWSVSCWAPFAFMGVEINRLASTSSLTPALRGGDAAAYSRVEDEESDNDIELAPTLRHGVAASSSTSADPSPKLNGRARDSDSDSTTVLHLNHRPSPHGAPATGELAGIYLGVLNVYTTLPQFLGTFIAWVVFMIMEPGKSVEGVEEGGLDLQGKQEGINPIAVCLFIGAMSAIAAAEATRRFRMMGVVG